MNEDILILRLDLFLSSSSFEIQTIHWKCINKSKYFTTYELVVLIMTIKCQKLVSLVKKLEEFAFATFLKKNTTEQQHITLTVTMIGNNCYW